MSAKSSPSYDLDKIKQMLLNSGTRWITDPARDGAVELGYLSYDEMVHFIQYISHSEFHKTMPSKKVPGVMQDVYRTSDGTDDIYIKLGMNLSNTKAVISGFKKK